MEFIGSTAFALPEVTSQNPSSGSPAPTEEVLTETHERTARLVRIFLNNSLPQLLKAAEGHSVQHVVFWHSALPEKLRDELKAELNRVSGFPLVECHSFTDPISLDYSDVSNGPPAPDSLTFARYWLAPNDVVSLDFFNTVAKYEGPEYAGMNLKLFGGLEGCVINNDITVVRPQNAAGDTANAIEIRERPASGLDTLLPLRDNRKFKKSVPTIVDGSSIPQLTLHIGRTVALWKEPEGSIDSGTALDSVKQNAVRENFPHLNGPVHFSTAANLELVAVSERIIQADFFSPVRGFTLDITLSADEGVKSGHFYVSYQLTDYEGVPVPPDAELAGIGRIGNPEIAHCFVPEVVSGESRIVKHIRPPAGVLCSGVKFIRRDIDTPQIDVISASMLFDLRNEE